jgi:hypothetical protein
VLLYQYIHLVPCSYHANILTIPYLNNSSLAILRAIPLAETAILQVTPKPTETSPKMGLSVSYTVLRYMPDSPCRKAQSTLLPVCNNGCPATISINLCNPSLRCSITSSVNLFVKIYCQLCTSVRHEMELPFQVEEGY